LRRRTIDSSQRGGSDSVTTFNSSARKHSLKQTTVTQITSSDDASTVDAPPTFDILPLSHEVRKAVDALGYTHPTPVQRAVFESVASGRDVVVQARTGTGKTAAFGLPVVDRLVDVERK